jgi:hypothetical protein
MTSQAHSTHLPPHTPGAGAKLLAEYLGHELPEISEEEKVELLARADAAMEEARRYYGRGPSPA